MLDCIKVVARLMKNAFHFECLVYNSSTIGSINNYGIAERRSVVLLVVFYET